MADVSKWHQYVPKELWHQYVTEEAHACSIEVQAWVESNDNERLRDLAMESRRLFLEKFIKEHGLSEKVMSITGQTPEEELLFRFDIIRQNQQRLVELLSDLDDNR